VVGLRTVRVYASVAALVVSFIVGLLALATESAPLGCSQQDGAGGVEPIRPVPPSPTGPEQEASPALDVASLEKRLRETKAIGFFTKISLKNQVDDLRGQFRALHEARSGATLPELRERYDLLLLKVLSLLQDGDPLLACDISASREVLWSLLADPAKFRNL
jgi:hypothetical protein